MSNVSLKKPDYDKIKNNRNLMAFDMHVHTNYSDGANKVATILKKTKKLGIGVAITDHNTIAGSLKALDNDLGVPVIPGIEVTTKEGLHLLIYFKNKESLKDYYNKNIKNKKSKHPYLSISSDTKTVINATQCYDCLIAAAHPFSPTKMGLATSIKKGYLQKDIVPMTHAIECVCGSHLNYMNKKAIKWAKDLDKPVVGGTDAHILGDFGKIITYAECEDIEGFIKKVLCKENFVVGKGRSGVKRLVQYFSMATISSFSRHAKFLVPMFNIKYHSLIIDPIKHYGPRAKKKIGAKFKKTKNR